MKKWALALLLIFTASAHAAGPSPDATGEAAQATRIETGQTTGMSSERSAGDAQAGSMGTGQRTGTVSIIGRQPAVAGGHKLQAYNALIRKEAGLPAEWFTCITGVDCALASVPCHWSIAVNVARKDEAQEVLNKKFSRCLGLAADISAAASCEAGECVTREQNPAPLVPRELTY